MEIWQRERTTQSRAPLVINEQVTSSEAATPAGHGELCSGNDCYAIILSTAINAMTCIITHTHTHCISPADTDMFVLASNGRLNHLTHTARNDRLHANVLVTDTLTYLLATYNCRPTCSPFSRRRKPTSTRTAFV